MNLDFFFVCHTNKNCYFLYLKQVPPEFKLPILYLIDSIVKNVKSTYVQLFSQCIVNIFCGVFEKVSSTSKANSVNIKNV